MDTLTGMKRTDYCGNFTTEQIGQEVTVYGWAQRQRDLGNLIFIDLRDRTGILQHRHPAKAGERQQRVENRRD